MSRIVRLLTSLKTTLALLCLLALLLLLSMLLPQRSVIGDEAFAQLVTSSPTARFFLLRLGLGSMPTSPWFLGALGLFFANLGAVLTARARPTWRRIGFRPRPEAGLRSWAWAEPELSGVPPRDFGPGSVVGILRGFGYRPKKVGERAVWGVKHRTAALGFLLFHLSFFLLCAGGVLLYYTRFVGSVALTEGQEFDGEYRQVLRLPPSGEIPVPIFSLVSVDPRFEGGEPTHLGAVLRFSGTGMSAERPASINHPASWGAARIYVQQAGLTPVFWLQDAQGFTLDRVAAPVSRAAEATEVPLDGDRLAVFVESPGRFPHREDLSGVGLEIEVVGEAAEPLFRGRLGPGAVADLGGERLVLEEIRYWAGIQVISERGGGVLIAGFVIGIAGLIWRLMLHRREVAVVWDDDRFTLVGRSEYFPWRFREELSGLFSTLGAAPAATDGGGEGERADIGTST